MRPELKKFPIEGPSESSVWKIKDQVLSFSKRPLVMGILNVTSDSFYDGGRYLQKDQAVSRLFQLAEEGADLIDIGGLSTRPGSLAISWEEEADRILPVLESVSRSIKIPISVDTYRAKVARAGLEAGARIINDVGGLGLDPEMASVVGSFGAGLILMHIRGTPLTMQENTDYPSLLDDILIYFQERIHFAFQKNIHKDQILVDPGIGFGKNVDQNLELLKNLDFFRRTGRPVLIGASRKSFIGRILQNEAKDRLVGSLACAASAFYHGAAVLRVHDVKETVEFLKMLEALENKKIHEG